MAADAVPLASVVTVKNLLLEPLITEVTVSFAETSKVTETPATGIPELSLTTTFCGSIYPRPPGMAADGCVSLICWRSGDIACRLKPVSPAEYA